MPHTLIVVSTVAALDAANSALVSVDPDMDGALSTGLNPSGIDDGTHPITHWALNYADCPTYAEFVSALSGISGVNTFDSDDFDGSIATLGLKRANPILP